MKCVIAAVGLFLFLNPSLGVEIVMKAESPIKMGVPARFFFASAAAPTAGRNNGEIPMLAGISACDKNAIAHSGLNTQVQTASYDIFTYTIPAGFELTTQNNTVLVLEKKEGKHYCQLVLYAAKEAQTDAGKNFIQNWDFFARNPQQGIADPATSETGTFNNWQVRTGTAQGTFNRQPFSLTLRSFTKNSLNYFVGAVFTDARYVPAVQQFMDGVLADDTKNAVAKRPPDDTPMAQGSSSPLTQPVTSFNDGWTSTYVGPYVKVAKEGIEAWIFPANDSLDKAARQPDAVFEDKYWRYAVDRFFQTRHVAERPWQMSGPGNDKIFEAEVKNRQTGQENFVAMRVICSSGRCQSVLALAPTKQLLYSSVFANYNTFEQILPYNKFMPALPLLRGAWQGGEAGATGSYSIAGGFQGGNAKVAFKDEFVFKADNSYQSKHGLKQRNESKGEGYVQQYKGSYSLNGQTLQLTGWRPGDPGIFECWMEAAQGGLALILVNKKFTGQRYLLYRVP